MPYQTATLLLLLITAISTSGCDCFQNLDGVVVDAETGQALDSVRIFNRSLETATFSKPDGTFSDRSTSSGFDCAELDMVFSLPGYQNFEMLFPGSQDSLRIELQPE